MITLNRWTLSDGWWRRFRSDGIIYADVFPSLDFPGNWKWVIWCETFIENCPQGEAVGADEAKGAVDAILATRKDILAAGISAATSKESESE